MCLLLVSVSSSGPYTGSFAQSNVGTAIAVTPTTTSTVISGVAYDTMAGVTLTGAAAGNYYVTGPTLSVAANITPYIIVPGASSGPRIVPNALNKVYDTTTVANGSLAMTGLFGTDSVLVSYTSAAFASPNVANGITVTFTGATLSGADASNYSIGAGSITATANITKAPLTITANTQSSFVTKDIEHLSYSSIGLLGSDTITFAIPATTATSSSLAGNYPITVASAVISSGASNYEITYVPSIYTVIPAGQLRVATSGATTPYGTTATYSNPTVSYMQTNGTVISNLVFQSLSNGLYTYGDGTGATVAFNLSPTGTTTSTSGNIVVGTYPLAATNLVQSNTNITNSSAVASGDLTVTPLAINIAATPASYVYNGTTRNQATTTTPAILTGDLVAISGAATGRNVGIYGSNLSAAGADAANYSFTYTNANLTITPYIIVPGATTGPRINAVADNKIYDTTTTATGALTMAGLFAGDAVVADYTSANFANPNVANGITVTFNGINLSGASAANYSIGSGAVTAPANITPAPLTIATGLTAQNKVYDTTTVASINATATQTLTGVLGSDLITVSSSGPYTGTFSQSNVGTGLNVAPVTTTTTINGVAYTTMAGVTLTGAAASNYYVTGLTTPIAANITPAPLTIAAGVTAQNKVYDGTTAATITASTQTLSGVLGGDAVSVSSTGPYTGTFSQ